METSKTPRPNPKRLLHGNSLLRYSAMTTQMAVVIFLFIYLGRYLDRQGWLSFPLFTLVGSLFGVGIALYGVIRDLFRSDKV